MPLPIRAIELCRMLQMADLCDVFEQARAAPVTRRYVPFRPRLGRYSPARSSGFAQALNWCDAWAMLVHGAESGWYRMLHDCFLARRVLIILTEIDDEADFAPRLEEHISEVRISPRDGQWLTRG